METLLKLASETPRGEELTKVAIRWLPAGLTAKMTGLAAKAKGISLGNALAKGKSVMSFERTRQLMKARATGMKQQIPTSQLPSRMGIARSALPGAGAYAGLGAGAGGGAYAYKKKRADDIDVDAICKEAMAAANETHGIIPE